MQEQCERFKTIRKIQNHTKDSKPYERFKNRTNDFFKTMVEYFQFRARKTDGTKNSSQ